MAAAAEGIELAALEVRASSRSDARGLLGMAEADGAPVSAGPRDVQLHVRIAAPASTANACARWSKTAAAVRRSRARVEQRCRSTCASTSTPDSRLMDALSETLRVVRLVGAIFIHGRFTAPWCYQSPQRRYGRAASSSPAPSAW